MHTRRHLATLPVCVLFATRLSLAATTNRTIDDTNGDLVTGEKVIYQPDLSLPEWKQSPCSDCDIQPDLSRAFNETWTAALYQKDPISATMTFNGTAIYVYFILANNPGAVHPKQVTETAANFTLDSQEPMLYKHTPDNTTTALLYNQLVFRQTDLENTQHLLVISVSGPNTLWVNFDYAIYTHEDLDDVSSSQPEVETSAKAESTKSPMSTTNITSTSARAQPTSLSSSGTPSPTQTATTASPAPVQTPTQTNGSAKSRYNPSVIGGGVGVGVASLALLGIGVGVFMRHRRQQKATQRVVRVAFPMNDGDGYLDSNQ